MLNKAPTDKQYEWWFSEVVTSAMVKSMLEVGVREAKVGLSRLIKAALNGEQVVITNRGKALVRLTPEIPKTADRRASFGSWKDLLADLPDNWDSPQSKAEVTGLFEGLDE